MFLLYIWDNLAQCSFEKMMVLIAALQPQNNRPSWEHRSHGQWFSYQAVWKGLDKSWRNFPQTNSCLRLYGRIWNTVWTHELELIGLKPIALNGGIWDRAGGEGVIMNFLIVQVNCKSLHINQNFCMLSCGNSLFFLLDLSVQAMKE